MSLLYTLSVLSPLSLHPIRSTLGIELQGVLPKLQRRRLQQLVQDLNVPPFVRKKAEALLGPACLAGSMGDGRAQTCLGERAAPDRPATEDSVRRTRKGLAP